MNVNYLHVVCKKKKTIIFCLKKFFFFLFRFGDIWSIRIFVHNGLSVMLAWQIALIGFSSLYTCNTLLLSSTPSYHISEST